MPSQPPAVPPDTLPAEPALAAESRVRAVVWPTRGLVTRERWFDELYVWTEGQQPGTMQRARIQLDALNKGFAMLEEELSTHVAVTLSFGTIERCLDLVTQVFDAYRLHCHRMAILVRGQIDRIRSPYRVQSFLDWLRTQQIPVGYRLTAPRIGMEMKAIDFVRPDFAKVLAPQSRRLEFWQDALLEARAAGLNPEWLIIAGIETAAQRELAAAAGYRFAQGTAIKPCHPPPPTQRFTLPWPGARDTAPENAAPA
jgi:hypothetical protein